MRSAAPFLLATLTIAFLAPSQAYGKGGSKPAHHSAPKMPHLSPPKMPHHNPPRMPHLNPPKVAHLNPPKPHHDTPRPAHHQATRSPHHGGTPPAAIPMSPPHHAYRGYSGGYHRGYGYHRRYSGRHYYARSLRPRRYPVHPNPATLLAQARLRRLGKLKADLDGLKPQSTITQAQKDRIALDLMALAEGPHRIGKAPVQQLAFDLAEALGRRRRAAFDSESLALYLGELMNSANTSRAAIKPALARGRTLLHSAGVEAIDTETVANGFRDVLVAYNPEAGKAIVR